MGRRAGRELARLLGVRVGDKVTLVAPGGQVTPAGVVPRLKQFTVAGTFETPATTNTTAAWR
jgi:lipoprotein-releasing system permease protein